MRGSESGRDVRRWSWTGLLVGAAVPVPAAVLALAVPSAERLAPLLVPGGVLLRPLSDAMAGWNGALNMVLISVANGVLYAAVAFGLALLLPRRGEPGGTRRISARTVVGTLLLAPAVLAAVAAVTVSGLAARHADQAADDLRTVALDAGFDDAADVRVSYPFLFERLGMVSRNEEPFPFGYSWLDLELDGCRLDEVYASVVPHSRSWLPRPVDLRDVRFQHEYREPAVSEAAGSFRRVEFRTAAELLDRLAEVAPDGVSAQEHLCRLQSPSEPVATDPVPVAPAS